MKKFPKADDRLTTQMKSVGEVMAMGSTFQESFQKALRGLETDKSGLNPIVDITADDSKGKIRSELLSAGADRIFYLADGFRMGMSLKEAFVLSKIDPWFLAQVEDLVISEENIKGLQLDDINVETMLKLKQKGFSDKSDCQNFLNVLKKI